MNEQQKRANVPAVVLFAGSDFNSGLRSQKGEKWNLYQVWLTPHPNKAIAHQTWAPLRRLGCDEDSILVQMKVNNLLYQGKVLCNASTKYGTEVGVLNLVEEEKKPEGITEGYKTCDTDACE